MAHEDLLNGKLESLGKELETVQGEYKKIVEERKSICFEGYGMGLVLGIILVIFNLYQKKRKLTRLSMVCIVASTMFIIQYFYYILQMANLSVRGCRIFLNHQYFYYYCICLV